LFIVEAQTDKETKKTAKAYLEQADKYFRKFKYPSAVEYYKKAIDADAANYRTMYQLAGCYQTMSYYKDAEQYYTKIVDNKPADYPLAQFWLAKMIKASGEYNKAVKTFKKFTKSVSDEHNKASLYLQEVLLSFKKIANNEIKGCKIANKLIKKPIDISIINVGSGINKSDKQEFGAVLVQENTLLFTGTVSDKKGIDVNRLFESRKGGNTWGAWGARRLFSIVPDSKADHIGSLTFSADKKRIYYTICKDTKIMEKECKIYYSQREGEQWSKPQKPGAVVNEYNYTSKHPMVAVDSVTEQEYLFYSSDRKEGGWGGLDIWYCKIDKNGNFSQPTNLGPTINTKWNEVTPFYDIKTTVLYFSSDGHLGLGELDIFVSRGNPAINRWKNVVNVGYPLNSSADDSYLSFSSDFKVGYLASNRPDEVNNYGTGFSDIYEFIYLSVPPFLAFLDTTLVNVVGRVTHKGLKPYVGANVDLLDEEGNIIDSTVTDEKGRFAFLKLLGGRVYLIKINEEDADLDTDIFLTNYKGQILQRAIKKGQGVISFKQLPLEYNEISLFRVEDPYFSVDLFIEEGNIGIIGKVVDKEDVLEGIEDLEVYLHDESEKLVDSTKTDTEGMFKFENLPEEEYSIKIDSTETETFVEMIMVNDKGKVFKCLCG